MSANLGDAVYGLIAISALLAAESASRETYGETIGAVVLTLCVYWLAHSYADSVSRRLAESEYLTPAGLARSMWHELPLLGGAALPLITLLICWAAGAGLTLGVRAALWTAAAAIIVVEVSAGLRAKLSGRQLMTQAMVGAAVGLLVLALRLVLH